MVKLVGTTFKNDMEDGGRHRQEILKEMFKAGRRIVTVNLIYTTFNDKFAIKVQDALTKEIIGWIAEKDLDIFKHRPVKTMTAFLMKYNTYCVQLDMPVKPTREEHAYMQALCEQNGWAMPAYDKRAYDAVFAPVFQQLYLFDTK